MRLVPKDQDWTAYGWLFYLLFFLLAGWKAACHVERTPRTRRRAERPLLIALQFGTSLTFVLRAGEPHGFL